jgi:hypothetical protein
MRTRWNLGLRALVSAANAVTESETPERSALDHPGAHRIDF